MSKNIGKVSKVIGAVVDVEFSSKEGTLPNIYDSLEIKKEDGTILVLEVQSHIGENVVRTISMDSTDGLSRGTEVEATGNPINTHRCSLKALMLRRVHKCNGKRLQRTLWDVT